MSFQLANIPMNIEPLILTREDIKTLQRIEVLDIFAPSSRNFHSKGLFSTDIFGKTGEERRNRLFAYIDMHTEIIHPTLFKSIYDLKALYGDILSGKEYAIFDTEMKDFVKSNPIDGNTGFSFFINHYKDIVFEQRPSPKREFNIRLIDKYRNNSFFDKLLVLPAGLRDYMIDDNGKPSEDEINSLYRKVLSIASVIDNVDAKRNEEYLDAARFNLQLAVNDVYNYLKNLLEGKNKFIQGKWAARKVFNSTRNVITSYLHDSPELFGDTSVSTNQTVIGLYQYLRMIFPLSVKLVRESYLSDIFLGPNSPVLMVNKKTLKKEQVRLEGKYYDEWMTMEGLEKVFARYGQNDLRHEVLATETHYFGLLYKGPQNDYLFLQDIDDLPSHLDKAYVKPITFTELLYLSVFKDSAEIPCLITRYPITGYGSIYPSYIYLRTTIKSEVRYELGPDGERTGIKAVEFPIEGDQFYNSMSPSSSHLGRLTADFDKQHCRF